MKVGELCTRRVEVAKPQERVLDAARRIGQAAHRTLVVVDELGRPLGIATERDLVTRCLAEGRDPRRTALERVMSAPVVWVREQVPLEQALEEMTRLRVRHLPVVDERDRLTGILALEDLIVEKLGSDSPLARALAATP